MMQQSATIYQAQNYSQRVRYKNQEEFIVTAHVSHTERVQLNKIYQKIMRCNSACEITSAREFSEEIKIRAPHFASELMALCDVDSPCAVFISGLPMIEYNAENVAHAELISLCYALIIGEPFQYMQQNEAKLVARISPQEGYETSQSGLSRGNFGWHTDDRIFSTTCRTEWIQLLGMHNPSQSQTLLAPIDLIVEKLPPSVLTTLMENRFEVKMPTSFGFKSNIWSEAISLIWLNAKGKYEVGVPTYHVRTVDREDHVGQDALTVFFKTIDACRYSVTISPDSLLIFNNNRLLHGRTPIIGDRMVLRTYIRRDLTELQQQTNTTGHVFDARFLL